MKLNAFNSFSGQIIELMANAVVTSSKGDIKSYYEYWQKYENVPQLFSNSIIPSHFHIPQTAEKIGLDFPAWVTSGKGQKVMIIAQDPKRNFGAKGEVSLGAPFGIQDKYKVYYPLFEALSKEMDIYVTDLYKYYFEVESKESNQLPSFTGHSVHQEILQQEIDIFQPDLILVFGVQMFREITGKHAKNNEYKIGSPSSAASFMDRPIAFIPHPSPANAKGQQDYFKNHGLSDWKETSQKTANYLLVLEQFFKKE